MSEPIEIYIDLNRESIRVGTLFRVPSRDRETISFEYHPSWLAHSSRFALEPALAIGEGRFYPEQGREMFGAIGDSAPDTWGRQLMRRSERRKAKIEDRQVRTLHETDFLLGVSDVSRLGALRLKRESDERFQAPTKSGVPGFIALGQLLESAQRVERGIETDSDLQMIFAPGSSLGGARPKASIIDQHGNLAIAKFPKDTDEYSIETWEHIALTLADMAGIYCSEHELVKVAKRPVLISKRFDRMDGARIPFLSAMSLLQLKDGDRASYPEIIDEMTNIGASVKTDAPELFRRMVFNILISNVDDHLRNHGFLLQSKNGWVLSPVYDLNPTPEDVRARVLTTSISPDDATCSIDLALDQANFFNIKEQDAKNIILEVAKSVSKWRTIASRNGLSKTLIDRMETAFEHVDLEKALKFDA
jgi:serine/threonine-protein kinase HipA